MPVDQSKEELESNRRSAVRKRPRGWITIECRRRGTFGASIGDVVWDISQTGLCMVVKTAVFVGDDLELTITTTSINQTLRLQGRVIWVDPLDNKKFSIGVRFQESLPYSQLSQLIA